MKFYFDLIWMRKYTTTQERIICCHCVNRQEDKELHNLHLKHWRADTATEHISVWPLDPNPKTELDRFVNELRRKYRTYVVGYDIERGSVPLPTLFGHDFGDQIGRFATLVDENNNQFEVLVERNNTGLYLTRGWHALRDFYRIGLGAWVSMFFVGEGRFEITIQNRFRKKMRIPNFRPSVRFEIDRDMLPFLMVDAVPRPYVHDPLKFQFTYEKRLTGDEIDSGWMMLAYGGVCEQILNKACTSVKLVDDCGNAWLCTVVYGTHTYEHFKIGGGWKRMVDARRIKRGSHVVIGAPMAGSNETLYWKMIS